VVRGITCTTWEDCVASVPLLIAGGAGQAYVCVCLGGGCTALMHKCQLLVVMPAMLTRGQRLSDVKSVPAAC
jgi:hypothetical protein